MAKREAVIKLYGNTCHLCDEEIDLSLPPEDQRGFTQDHVIPKIKGGRNHLPNIRPAHKECNNNRGELDVDVYRRRIRRPPAESLSQSIASLVLPRDKLPSKWAWTRYRRNVDAGRVLFNPRPHVSEKDLPPIKGSLDDYFRSGRKAGLDSFNANLLNGLLSSIIEGSNKPAPPSLEEAV